MGLPRIIAKGGITARYEIDSRLMCFKSRIGIDGDVQ